MDSSQLIQLIQSPIINEFETFKKMYDASLLSTNPLLNTVTDYLQQRRGKMMRPVLVLLAAKLCGDIRKETFHAAISLELLHTASLLHDDVIDESLERRGQPSINAIFDNKIAILSGDYLLAVSMMQGQHTHNEAITEVIADLAGDLADGELLQLSNRDNRFFSEDTYFNVIRKKTAALFSSCAKSGAISSGADADKVERARLLGEYIGICFQIRDDIFDYFDDKEIGKPTGNDMREGRLTLPTIYALNSSCDERAKSVALRVKSGTASTEEINELTAFAKQRNGIEHAQKVMNDYKEKALILLSEFPDTEVKTSLIAYLDYVISRNK